MTIQLHRDLARAHTDEADRLSETEPPDVEEPPIEPPDETTPGGWPEGWDRDDVDADEWDEHTSTVYPHGENELLVMLSIDAPNNGEAAVQDSQNGWTGYRLETFRIRGREGPRAAGAPIVLEDGIIEVAGNTSEGDHADGIQSYQGSGVTIRGVKVLMGPGCNAAILSADSSSGVIDVDGMYVGLQPGNDTPAAWGFSINPDGGDVARIRGLRVERGCSMYGDVRCDIDIEVWEDNAYTDGTPIERPRSGQYAAIDELLLEVGRHWSQRRK